MRRDSRDPGQKKNWVEYPKYRMRNYFALLFYKQYEIE